MIKAAFAAFGEGRVQRRVGRHWKLRRQKMKTKDVLALKKGDVVKHSRYGISEIVEVMMRFGSLFGIQILPQTDEGKALLRHDAGVDNDMPFLENSVRRLALETK